MEVHAVKQALTGCFNKPKFIVLGGKKIYAITLGKRWIGPVVMKGTRNVFRSRRSPSQKGPVFGLEGLQEAKDCGPAGSFQSTMTQAFHRLYSWDQTAKKAGTDLGIPCNSHLPFQNRKKKEGQCRPKLLAIPNLHISAGGQGITPAHD